MYGSGKTTLAKNISNELKIPWFSLDKLITVDNASGRGVTSMSQSDSIEVIHRLINKKQWIIEGAHAVDDIFKYADAVVYINISLYKNIYQVIKRYLTDKETREKHGFMNNIKFCLNITDKYHEPLNMDMIGEVHYKNIAKYKYFIDKYKDKVFIYQR